MVVSLRCAPETYILYYAGVGAPLGELNTQITAAEVGGSCIIFIILCFSCFPEYFFWSDFNVSLRNGMRPSVL